MEYELVYDAARDFAGWQLLVGWLALFGFLLITIYEPDRVPKFIYALMRIDETDTGLGMTILGVSVLILGAISIATMKHNFDLHSISKANDCTQIEGVVTGFEKKNSYRNAVNERSHKILGHKELFSLNDVAFEYETNFMSTGFNKAAANGGPIYEGAKVRLCYIEKIEKRRKERKIIRVETVSISQK